MKEVTGRTIKLLVFTSTSLLTIEVLMVPSTQRSFLDVNYELESLFPSGLRGLLSSPSRELQMHIPMMMCSAGKTQDDRGQQGVPLSLSIHKITHTVIMGCRLSVEGIGDHRWPFVVSIQNQSWGAFSFDVFEVLLLSAGQMRSSRETDQFQK